MRVCPILGDLKFVDLTDGAECFVEAKKNHLRIIEDEETGSRIWQHKQDRLHFKQSAIFTWKVQWDFLYTTYTHQRDPDDKRAFLIPRDEVPTHWWNTPILERGDIWLDWPSNGTHGMEEYAIDMTADKLLVRDMVKILETRRLKCGSIKARNPIEMVPLHDLSLDEISTSLSDVENDSDDAEGDVNNERRDAWSSSDYRRGFGSFRHPELKGATYDVWAAAVLMEICRQK